jgi:protoporphyrinogen oxidase
VHFPLKPFDLVTRLPPGFMAGVFGDAVAKRFRSQPTTPTFASILENGLGRTICRDFYFPYARKIWGASPDALDPEQAKRRVANSSIGKMLRRIAGAVPGFKRPGAGRFFYPRHGFGQISAALRRAAEAAGAEVHVGAAVTGVNVEGGRVCSVDATVNGAPITWQASYVLSTIPITALSALVRSDGSAPPRPATEALQQRAMILIYLLLDRDQFTEFDAHYFPEEAVRITRLSEPKNYSQTVRAGRTVLCAELPCATSDEVWGMSDEDLGALVVRDLEHARLGPVPGILRVETRRLPNAYPLYTKGYRSAFDALDTWAGSIGGLVTFGRQGLFAHDNTHHTMAMAYALADCIQPDGEFDEPAWRAARESFESHVVED